ncbi:MAG TPA: DUF1634 domain-containing protein [Candidatus Binataceae bacterium]|nr:DUF1634 domain-containing protein [Candidatus Binataceae bacterium]
MDNSIAEEERILRVWTPILLRTILVAAIVLLLAGLIVMAWHNPGQYVARFHRLQSHTRYENRQSLAYLASTAIGGNSRSIMTLGLMVLTLVPLVRVAFCFLLFLRERDGIYVMLTAYVLIGLVVGVILGRVG